jgi:prolyl-tRNA editing enzyme YbaK/EbsC (Cys-tRNA(Pro) deacylase)
MAVCLKRYKIVRLQVELILDFHYYYFIMSIEKVREYFSQYGMDVKILEFPVSSATVELASQALRCEPERIAKTMSFMLDDRAILVVTAGDMKIDNHKYKATFAKKAKMLSPEEVLDKIGHAVGGVCPFGIPADVEVYLDVSLKRFTTVFPACGSSNSAIELTIPQLEKYSNGKKWIDVCKSSGVSE